MEKEKILIKMEDGSNKEADVLLYFLDDEINKKFIIYTFNEKDEKGLVIIYSAIVVEDEKEESGFRFENITDEKEWSIVKDAMKKIITEWKEAE